jgi:hypothetical protein
MKLHVLRQKQKDTKGAAAKISRQELATTYLCFCRRIAAAEAPGKDWDAVDNLSAGLGSRDQL